MTARGYGGEGDQHLSFFHQPPFSEIYISFEHHRLTLAMFQVMVEGRLPPKVKRDAHDVILEFIRSRPPLKPVSKSSAGLLDSLFQLSAGWLLAGWSD